MEVQEKNGKSGLKTFLSSNAGKRFFNITYSWGASIVIIGALLKLLHLPYANPILILGMVTEAVVFFISGFDDSNAGIETKDEQESESLIATGAYASATTSASSTITDQKPNIKTGVSTGKPGQSKANPAVQGYPTQGQGGGVSTGGVIVSGGGNLGNANVGGGNISGGNTPTTGDVAGGGIGGGTIIVGGGSAGGSPVGSSTPSQGFGTAERANTSQGKIDDLSATAKGVEGFSQTMNSLNEASSTLLASYKEMIDNSKNVSDNSQGFAENMKSLNENMMSLNGSLKNIQDQMYTLRYMNDTLERIKNFYDGAMVDSSIYKQETEKMTRQIEALNKVYARMLQAMTSNNTPPVI